MAGMGEACSHVVSLPWAIEAGCRLRESLTVTQKKAHWVLPPVLGEVPYARIRDIKFIGKKGSALARQSHSCNEERSAPSALSTPSERFCSTITISLERKRSFFDALAGCSTKPAVLALKQEYHELFIPESMQPNLPSRLTNLYDVKLLSASYVELLAAAETVRIDVSKEKCLAEEENTREQ